MSATVLALKPRQDVEQTLANLEQACALLQEVRTIQDAKQIHDVAKAAKVYASEHKLGREIVMKARAVTFEALRRIGELLMATGRATGGQPYQASSTCSEEERVATLYELGLTRKASWHAQHLAALQPAVFARVRDGEITIEKVISEARRAAEAARDTAMFEQMARINASEPVVMLRGDLYASGIKPDVVITEVPIGRLHLLSDFALWCVDVPLVVTAMDPQSRDLPEVLQRLCAHLTYRGLGIVGKKLLLIFYRDRPRVHFATSRHGWAYYSVQRFTEPGNLIVDPFNSNAVTDAASGGRLFVGGCDDAAVIADVRRQVEKAR